MSTSMNGDRPLQGAGLWWHERHRSIADTHDPTRRSRKYGPDIGTRTILPPEFHGEPWIVTGPESGTNHFSRAKEGKELSNQEQKEEKGKERCIGRLILSPSIDIASLGRNRRGRAVQPCSVGGPTSRRWGAWGPGQVNQHLVVSP